MSGLIMPVGPMFDDYCARHGQDTESVLSDLGITSEQILKLKQRQVI